MSVRQTWGYPEKHGLYDPAYEKDSCGVGIVAHIKGQRSHQLVLDADHVLRRMAHRGACGCEATTGDGAGMLTALPHEFLAKVAQVDLRAELPEPGKYGAGLVFLPTMDAEREKCKRVVERIIAEQGQRLTGTGRRRHPLGRRERGLGMGTWDRVRGENTVVVFGRDDNGCRYEDARQGQREQAIGFHDGPLEPSRKP